MTTTTRAFYLLKENDNQKHAERIMVVKNVQCFHLLSHLG